MTFPEPSAQDRTPFPAEASWLRKPNSYNSFLAILSFFALAAFGWTAWRLTQTLPILSLVLRAVPAATGAVGQIGVLAGPARLAPNPRHTAVHARILDFVSGRLAVPALHAEGTFTHSEGSGDDAKTITDWEFDLFQPFEVAAGSETWAFPIPPTWWIHPVSESLDMPATLADLSRRSSTFSFAAFAPVQVVVIGPIGRQGQVPTMAPTSEQPMLVSDLPLAWLRAGFLASCGALLVVLLTFTWLLATNRESIVPNLSRILPLRGRFEGKPDHYFVFEVTGGPESNLSTRFGWFLALSLLVWFLWPFSSPVAKDLGAAVFALVCLHFLRQGPRQEFFLVANRADGNLYEVRHELGKTEHRRVCPITSLDISIRETTDSEGVSSYDLVSRGKRTPDTPLVLSDKGSQEDLRDILKAWKRFLGSIPTPPDTRAG